MDEAGYGAVWLGQKSWNGVAMLARGAEPVLTRTGLPDDPDDAQSRYIEAAVGGVLIGCLYVPNGNPVPGPKFAYKLRWLDRLAAHGDELLRTGVPVVLAGDYNIIPTELDVYRPERWVDDALFRAEVREAFAGLVAGGLDRCPEACRRKVRMSFLSKVGMSVSLPGSDGLGELAWPGRR